MLQKTIEPQSIRHFSATELRRDLIMSKQTITITLKNGIIQDIKGLPDNIRIRVLDFDIDGVNADYCYWIVALR